jgi:NAD(P)H-flavin reductase
VGNGFRAPSNVRNLLCIGEGEAAWALLPAVLDAASAGRAAVTLAIQAHSGRDTILPERLPAAVEYRIATTDGSRGARGRLAPLLPDLLRWADAALVAGTLPFYDELIAAIEGARFGLNRGYAQVLYPMSFLCGTGACQACAADVAGGRRRVCLRGPVFDLSDLRGRWP